MIEKFVDTMDLCDKVDELVDTANAQEKRVLAVERVLLNEIAAQLPVLKERLVALADDLHKVQLASKLRGVQVENLDKRLESQQADIWCNLSSRIETLEKRRDTLSSAYESHYDLHIAEAKRLVAALKKGDDARQTICRRLDALEKGMDNLDAGGGMHAHLDALEKKLASCDTTNLEYFKLLSDRIKNLMRWVSEIEKRVRNWDGTELRLNDLAERLAALEEKHPMRIGLDEGVPPPSRDAEKPDGAEDKTHTDIAAQCAEIMGWSQEGGCWWNPIGHRYEYSYENWHPEIDIAQALSVLEKMREKYGSYKIYSPGRWADEQKFGVVWLDIAEDHRESAPTLPLAMCQAAIWAAM